MPVQLFRAHEPVHEQLYQSELLTRDAWLRAPEDPNKCLLVMTWNLDYSAIWHLLKANQGRLEQLVFVGVGLPAVGEIDVNSRKTVLQDKVRHTLALLPELNYIHNTDFVNSEPVKLIVYSNRLTFSPRTHFALSGNFWQNFEHIDTNMRQKDRRWRQYATEVTQHGETHPAHHRPGL